MLTRRTTKLGSSLTLLGVALFAPSLVGCGLILDYEDAYDTAPAGDAGAGGMASGAAGAAAGKGGGPSGASGAAGLGGFGGQPQAGAGGAAGTSAGGAAGAAGAGGSTGGVSGFAGAAGVGGSAGQGAQGGQAGQAGQAGASGAGGLGGTAGAAGAAGSAGAAGTSGNAGAGGSGGGTCPILYVRPPDGSSAPPGNGCSPEAAMDDISGAFGKAGTIVGLQEIRLCGTGHAAIGGLVLPMNVSLRGGYDCVGWQIPGIPEDVDPAEISFTGEKPSTLLRVPAGSTAPVFVEHVSLLAAPTASEVPRNVQVIGLDLVGGKPTVRYVRVEPPSAKVTDTTKTFASAGVVVRSSAQATIEHASVKQTKGDLTTLSDRASAGVGIAVDKDAQLIVSDTTVVSTDNRSSGIGTASLALTVQTGATVNVQGGSYKAAKGYSVDVKSSIVTGGILVSAAATLIVRGALVAAESGSAGPDDGTPSRANTVGIGGDLFSVLVIDATRVIADGGQGTGSSIALGSLGASVTATSSLFYGGSSGTAAATAGVLGAGKIVLDHCTLAAGRPRAGMQATGMQISEPANSEIQVRNSLFFADADVFAAVAVSGGCSVKAGQFSNNGIVLVGPAQFVGGGVQGTGTACAGSPFTCLDTLEAVFPVNGLTKNNQIYGVPGATICGSTMGSPGADMCASPTACLKTIFPEYTEADFGAAAARNVNGLTPRVCSLVRGGETSPVKTDLDGATRTASRPTIGASQATFTYVAVCP